MSRWFVDELIPPSPPPHPPIPDLQLQRGECALLGQYKVEVAHALSEAGAPEASGQRAVDGHAEAAGEALEHGQQGLVVG